MRLTAMSNIKPRTTVYLATENRVLAVVVSAPLFHSPRGTVLKYMYYDGRAACECTAILEEEMFFTTHESATATIKTNTGIEVGNGDFTLQFTA